MKIHELAQKTGLTAPTIRFYEEEGLLDTRHVQREENNYRDYSEGAVRHLLLLKKFHAAGFTLTEFKALIQADKANELPMQKIIELLYEKKKEISRKQAELEQVQTYLDQVLAHKMALMEAEEKGDAREEYQYQTNE